MLLEQVICTFSFHSVLAATGTCARICTTSSTIRARSETHFFPTVTCNTPRPKIKNALLAGQNVTDRPYLSAQVFRIDLRALGASIIDEQVFGEVKANVCVAEFLKEGPPHAHCIFTFSPTS